MPNAYGFPAQRHQMSLYASVTGIKWDFTGQQIAGGTPRGPSRALTLRRVYKVAEH